MSLLSFTFLLFSSLVLRSNSACDFTPDTFDFITQVNSTELKVDQIKVTVDPAKHIITVTSGQKTSNNSKLHIPLNNTYTAPGQVDLDKTTATECPHGVIELRAPYGRRNKTPTLRKIEVAYVNEPYPTAPQVFKNLDRRGHNFEYRVPPSSLNPSTVFGKIQRELAKSAGVIFLKAKDSYDVLFDYVSRGLKPEDLEVRLRGAYELSVTGEREKTEVFSKTVQVPENIELNRIIATAYSDGLLAVNFPVFKINQKSLHEVDVKKLPTV